MASMGFLRTSDQATNLSRAVQLIGQLSDARDAAVRYRAAVLAHGDLAARLAQLFGLSQPGNWRGYVPPRTDGHGGYNPSPYRQALVRIVAEAIDRDEAWQRGDDERLATVPDSQIAAPWTQAPGDRQRHGPQATLDADQEDTWP
jgi:hypothetical protein